MVRVQKQKIEIIHNAGNRLPAFYFVDYWKYCDIMDRQHPTGGGGIYMRFEEVKRGRRDNKAFKLVKEFVETRYDRVEVHNEEDYETNAQMAAALRFVVNSYYEGKLNVSRKGDRVFLSKIKEAK